MMIIKGDRKYIRIRIALTRSYAGLTKYDQIRSENLLL